MPARRGERHHKAKLTADDVRAIRSRRTSGETVEAIWLDYAELVSLSNVGEIVRHRTWRHVS